MNELNLDQLEELEDKLVPLLRRRNIKVQEIQPIGLLGKGASSSVWSLLINNKYHVLKVFRHQDYDSFRHETRNISRTRYPSRIVLTSRHDENSLGFDLILSEVPPGREFNSNDLYNDWTVETLGRHLLELHRVRRVRRLKPELQLSRFDRYWRVIENQVDEIAPEWRQPLKETYEAARQFFVEHTGMFNVRRSLIHNDLWWPNVIVAEAEIYLIDWEALRTGDYLEDVCRLRVMLDYWHLKGDQKNFWVVERDIAAANQFFKKLFDLYRAELPDPQIRHRAKFYLVFESFKYLRNLSNWSNQYDVRRLYELAAHDVVAFQKHFLDFKK